MSNRFLPILGLLAATACASAAPVPVTELPPAAVAPVLRLDRPLPYPIDLPRDYLAAIDRGTRTRAGEPGPKYWQQWTRYRLTARLLPDSKRLEGTASITYFNRSPDALGELHLQLTQNFHAPGAVRNEAAEVTGGMELARVEIGGRALGSTATTGARYIVNGTDLTIILERPVAPHDSAVIAIDWAFTIPQAGAGARMGYSADNLFFIAYWYPQMAVYDDVVGWQTDQFVGTSEFYSGFGDYDITIDAPRDWLVRGTGAQLNESETLSARVIERLRAAERSDTPVRVVTPAEFGTNATRSGTGATLRWRFRADSVRDVSFSATRASRLDAIRTPVGDRNGDGRTDYARIETLYREAATRWARSARYAAQSIRFHSQYTGLSYPYPHMTAVEGAGIIGGGMEFPMMTLIGDYTARGDSALYFVTAHELGHMWFPMMLATDERRYAWIDEGTTTFNENQARQDFYSGRNHNVDDQDAYIALAATGGEGEIMRRSNYHYTPQAYGVASYQKPASVLVALRGVLGEGTFNRAYREFIQRWKFKHPTPWDMWATFESVSGRDLDWFWRAWYYDTWTFDQAIVSVVQQGDKIVVTVEDRGRVPMPVLARVLQPGGVRQDVTIVVDGFLRGERRVVFEVPGPIPTRVEIDPDRHFPDVDRANNVWVPRP